MGGNSNIQSILAKGTFYHYMMVLSLTNNASYITIDNIDYIDIQMNEYIDIWMNIDESINIYIYTISRHNQLSGLIAVGSQVHQTKDSL